MPHYFNCKKKKKHFYVKEHENIEVESRRSHHSHSWVWFLSVGPSHLGSHGRFKQLSWGDPSMIRCDLGTRLALQLGCCVLQSHDLGSAASAASRIFHAPG